MIASKHDKAITNKVVAKVVAALDEAEWVAVQGVYDAMTERSLIHLREDIPCEHELLRGLLMLKARTEGLL